MGKEYFRNSSILYLGLIKGKHRECLYNIHNLSLKKNDHLIIYENDCEDTSLMDVAVNTYPVTYVNEKLDHEPLKQDKSLLRKTRMALYRNKLLELAKEKSGFDYLCVVDLDLEGGYSLEGIYSSLFHMRDKNVIIGSNGLVYNDGQRLYYDSWAYREINSWDFAGDEVNNRLRFERGEPLVEVNSCFGGLCFYPIDILKKGVYYTSADCDHVTLHKQLKDLGYKIYLNPSMITLYSENYYRTY